MSPDEIIFTQVMPKEVQIDYVTLTNTLGSPVDLVLKCSNPDRLDVNPKQIRLLQSQSLKVEIRLYQLKPFHTKSLKFKDFLFIKGEYFDQKLPIVIYPSSKSASSSSINQRDFQADVLAGDSFGRGVSQARDELRETQIALRNSFDKESQDEETDLIREKVQKLTTDNINLKERLEQSQNEISQLKSQSQSQEHLNQIREILKQREPNLDKLLEEAMRFDRQKQEIKEKKVLTILQQKDRQIEELQKRIVESELNLNHLKATQDESIQKIQQLQNQLDQSQYQYRQLELKLVDTQELLDDFRQTDLMQMQAQLQSQSAYIKDLESQKQISQKNENQDLLSSQILQTELEVLKESNSKIEKQNNSRISELNYKIEKSVQILGSICGKQDDIVISAQEAVKIVQRFQIQYNNLELDMNQLIETKHDKSIDLQNQIKQLKVQLEISPDQDLLLKVKEMKIKEDSLKDQLQAIQMQMKYQSSSDQSRPESQISQQNINVRVGELENIIFNQREQIVQLEQEVIIQKRKISDLSNQQSQIELLDIRNKNLQQLQRAQQSTQNSDRYNSIVSTKIKSPRNNSDQLSNLELKNKVQELSLQNDQLQNREKQLILQCDQLQLENVKLKQLSSLSAVGLNHKDSKLTVLIQDQKQRITQLENELKSDADVSIVRIRTDYLQKIETMSQAIENERCTLSQQLASAYQKIENLKTLIQNYENREIKQNKEIVKLNFEIEQKVCTKQQSKAEMESVINSKNQLITGLEQQLIQKERTLQDRQEQLSVLLSAMDNGNSTSNDQKQKLANLAAELCNQMIDKSNLQSQISEYQHQKNESHLQVQKLQQELEEQRKFSSQLQNKIKSTQLQINEQMRKIQDIDQVKLEMQNKQSDFQYTIDRNQYLIKSRDEIIASLKQQLKQQENSFRDTIQSLKQSLMHQKEVQPSRQRDSALKVAIKKLHLKLVECDNDEMFVEMENTLSIGAATIDKLQQDVEAKQKEIAQLHLEWDAFIMNNIIIQRYEHSFQLQRKISQLHQQQDIEQSNFIKQTLDQSNNIIKTLETQIEIYQSETEKTTEKLNSVSEQNTNLQNENLKLKQSINLFETQLQSQKESSLLAAQLEVDERFKSREELIKTYCEQRFDKLEIGREIYALKAQQMNLKKLNQIESAKRESSEINLKTMKQTLNDSNKEIALYQQKINQINAKNAHLIIQNTFDSERLKKANLKLEKDLIRLQEQLSQKSSEICLLKVQLEVQEHQPQQIVQIDQSSKIQQLQEENIDLRQNRMLEIDELRIQYEIEVAEARRSLMQQQYELEQKLGSAPGEVLNQNHDLRTQIAVCQQNENSLKNDNEFLRRQCMEFETNQENNVKEIEDLKQALSEVECVLVDRQNWNNNQTQSIGPLTDSRRSKSAVKKSKGSLSVPMLTSNLELNFSKNPPLIVKALVQAKVNEQTAKSRLRKQLQTETFLRHQLQQKLPNSDLVQDLINQNDVILSILNQPYQQIQYKQQFDENHNESDYNCLLAGVLSLATELAKTELSPIEVSNLHEQLPVYQVLQAQRIVIRSLAEPKQQIRYVPERELDRKIWMLELLESQVNDAEVTTDRLVDFIKRLQIAVTGNLQSAAEIRATSIDLANNTKEASQEIKTLRHVALLIKHELQSQHQSSNPFQETYPDIQRSSVNQSVDKLMTERDSAQNQLSLTQRIKQSLEQELINLKLQHATDMQSNIQNFKNLQQTHLQKLDQIEELNQKLKEIQIDFSNHSKTNEQLQIQLQSTQQQLKQSNEKLEKSSGSSTSLKKLQQDMLEWKKTSETNLKQKQDQFDQSQLEIQKLQLQLSKQKSEIQMLRRVQQDNRTGETSNSFLKEIDHLNTKIQSLDLDSQKLIQKTEEEKNELKEKINKLENIIAQGDSLAAQQANKLAKKVSNMTNVVQAKQSDILQVKDELTQLNLLSLNLNQQLKQAQQQNDKQSQKIDQQKQTILKLQQEKEELFRQKMQAIQQQEGGAQQLAEEMISLRELFLKLKLERDQLSEQLQMNQSKLEKKDKELRSNQQQVYVQQKDTHQDSIQVYQERIKALMNDLKHFKQQTDDLQVKRQELIEKQAQHDSQLLAKDQEMAGYQQKLDELLKQQKVQTQTCKTFELQIKQQQLELAECEASYTEKLKKLSATSNKARVDGQTAIHMLAQQIAMIKQSKGKGPVKEVDFLLQLVQKDSAIKQARKDLQSEKQKTIKLKQQKADLNQQIETKKFKIPKWKEELMEIVSDQNQLKKVIQQIKEYNNLESTQIELLAQCTQLETNLGVQLQVNEELQLKIEELQENILEQKSNAKDGKSTLIEKHKDQIKELKDQIKSLQQELSQVKTEFISVNETQPLLDQIQDLQNINKSQSNEISRKNKLLSTLRQQKDSQQSEVELLLQDLKGMKDDNLRLQKALKEVRSNSNELKEMKETYEWLQRQEKQMKEELVILHEKNKSLKIDCQRKDNQLSQMKDQCHQKSKDLDQVKELTHAVEKIKDEKKRLKLENDISQNQIKTLKQQIESARSLPVKENFQSNEQELKYSQKKAKKYENHLKKSLQVIQKVGSEIIKLAPSDNTSRTQSDLTSSQPDYLKDAGEILGVSLNELEDFINPSYRNHSQSSSHESKSILQKLQRIEHSMNADTLDGDIEEIGVYCVKLLDEMHQQY